MPSTRWEGFIAFLSGGDSSCQWAYSLSSFPKKKKKSSTHGRFSSSALLRGKDARLFLPPLREVFSGPYFPEEAPSVPLSPFPSTTPLLGRHRGGFERLRRSPLRLTSSDEVGFLSDKVAVLPLFLLLPSPVGRVLGAFQQGAAGRQRGLAFPPDLCWFDLVLPFLAPPL